MKMGNGKWTVFGSFQVIFFAGETANKSCNVIDGLRGGRETVLRGKFSKFLTSSGTKKNEFNWIDFECGTVCRLSTAPLKSACVWGRGKGGGGAKQGDYNSIKLPSGPASHWLTFALTFALSVIARAAALCLFGDLCCPARGLPLPHSPTRLRTENCLLPLLCLWCHNKRIMLPLVECESLPLVCQLPFVFAFLFACFTACLPRCSVFYSCCFVVA